MSIITQATIEKLRKMLDEDGFMVPGDNFLYGYETTFIFGKYKGQKVSTILDSDPDYLIWMLKENEKFKLTQKVRSLLSKIRPSQESEVSKNKDSII